MFSEIRTVNEIHHDRPLESDFAGASTLSQVFLPFLFFIAVRAVGGYQFNSFNFAESSGADFEDNIALLKAFNKAKVTCADTVHRGGVVPVVFIPGNE